TIPAASSCLSSSRIHGQGYLDHAEQAIRDLLGDRREVVFVPYALHDWEAYAETACNRFRAMGYHCASLHRASNSRKAIGEAEAIFVGGGNTFRLLKAMSEH